MHRFRPVHALLAAAALLAAIPAHGRATSSATLADFHIDLTDLDPSDGVAPSLTLDPQAYSIVGVMASNDVDFHSSRGDGAFAPVATSREIDSSGGSASFSGDPFGAGAVITASAFADNGGGATSIAEVDGPPVALYFGDFVLGPRSQVTFSGTGSIDWAASGAYPSTYAVLGLAMAAAGPVTSALGGRWIWAIGGIFCLLSGGVAVALAPRVGAIQRSGTAALEHVEPVTY